MAGAARARTGNFHTHPLCVPGLVLTHSKQLPSLNSQIPERRGHC